MVYTTTMAKITHYSSPSTVFSDRVIDILEDATGIRGVDAWTAIFFLLSKSEHDNEKWDDTFISDDGNSVFFFAKRLSYDGEQRGVTVGLAGWTTANDGKDAWGDFHKLAIRYKRMGGIDLRRLAKGLTKDKKKSEEFCDKIRSLHGEYAEKFVRAQFKDLCSKDGYICKSADALRKAGIECPSPLSLAIVMDTAINQGVGGKWCPVKWLEEHANGGDEKEIMRKFLDWKRVAATKNNHNDPPSNGEERSDMFRKLLDAGCFQLPRDKCVEVTKWKMK
jgi:hypothetical protein